MIYAHIYKYTKFSYKDLCNITLYIYTYIWYTNNREKENNPRHERRYEK